MPSRLDLGRPTGWSSRHPVRSPRLKILGRLGVSLPGLTRKTVGESPAEARTRRGRPSAYRLALEEKQKVRFNYGVTERQMRCYLDTARGSSWRTDTCD